MHVNKQNIVGPDNLNVDFNLNDADKERIIYGYDDIALTLKRREKIIEYENKMKKKKPWLFGNEQ